MEMTSRWSAGYDGNSSVFPGSFISGSLGRKENNLEKLTFLFQKINNYVLGISDLLFNALSQTRANFPSFKAFDHLNILS